MIDVDRLRQWAENIETYGADLTQWADPRFLVVTLRGLADNMDTVVRDVGRFRARRASGPPPTPVEARITEYLACGGLFNPDLMEHDKVRQLLIDCHALLVSVRQQHTTEKADLESRLGIALASEGTAFQQLAQFRKDMAWIRTKLELPDNAEMFKGDNTIAGRLHNIDHFARSYNAYVATDRKELQAKLTAAEAALAHVQNQWGDMQHLANEQEQRAIKAEAALAEKDREIERLQVEHTRAILRYTVKGYTAGENADSKHWRQRAEQAESTVTEQAQEIARLKAELEQTPYGKMRRGLILRAEAAEASLLSAQQAQEGLRDAILWALGVNGAFSEEPDPIAGKWRRRYWWRHELAQRADIDVNAEAAALPTQDTVARATHPPDPA